MTREIFLEEVGGLAETEWHLMEDGRIRTATLACPLAALAMQKYRRHYENFQYKEAGEDLGLSPEDVHYILHAADARRLQHRQVQAVRASLCQQLGLVDTQRNRH
jgi:hypothetical protein